MSFNSLGRSLNSLITLTTMVAFSQAVVAQDQVGDLGMPGHWVEGGGFETALNTYEVASVPGKDFYHQPQDSSQGWSDIELAGPSERVFPETSGKSMFGAQGKPMLMAQAETGNTGGSGGSAAADPDAAAIAEAMLNPLSYLWLLFTQNDMISYDGTAMGAIGEGSQLQNTTLLMPVLSQQLTPDWKMIFRPVIPINSFKVVDNVNVSIGNPGSITGVELDRQTGLGDVVLWTAFSKQYTPPNIFGFGFTAMLNTATDDFLGTGKNSVGPMALAVSITDKWVKGVVAQHWWSVGGDDKMRVNTDVGPVMVDRPDVNLTDLQVILRYRYSAMTNIGMAPNWRYNWETDEWSIPLGIGFDTMAKIGKIPAKVGLEAYYYVVQDDQFGPEWQLRFLFVPVMPAPESSRKPWFGN